ncbi:hypothetical protein GALL_172750 [mine drainage metagenome]|uniref:PKD domain protein n=1 Tax=mine drainage metagenome TaxID=410659 RepID=A0A1J5RWR5_9ZZZZ
MRSCILILFFITTLCNVVTAQTCNQKGQLPNIPFKICSNIISQTLQNSCTGTIIPDTCKTLSPRTDANATWYSFTSSADDSLGFVIEPFDLGDDFNWVLFDMTGRTVAEIYSNKKATIASDWSNMSGITGTSNAGTDLLNCHTEDNPFSAIPQISKGHQYLLLICYNGIVIPNKTGFKLTITKGIKSVVDTAAPYIQKVYENSFNCSASKVTVIMNKKIACNSLSVDASNFSITGFTGNLINANVLCGPANTGDTINIYTDTKLSTGNHQLIIHSDNLNSKIADECGNTVIDGETFSFSVVATSELKIDSIEKIGCKVDSIIIYFNKDINRTSLASDGSDFNFTGPSNIAIRKVVWYGAYIKIDFAKKVTIGGNDTLVIQKGTDGNTLIDDCGTPIPEGYSAILNFPDTIATNFAYKVGYGCLYDTIHFSNDGNNGLDEWYWMFNGKVSGSQYPSFTNIDSGENHLYVYFSNRRCSDSLSTLISLVHKNFDVSFTMQDGACAGDTVPIINTSLGAIDNYVWEFGDGTYSSSPYPGFHIYPTDKYQKTYIVSLTASRGNTCYKSFKNSITVLPNCYIAVPSAFTPNGDGLNDYLYPLNAYKADHLIFRVFNRFGQIVFETRDWTVKWDGTYKSLQQPSGTYVWTLDYTDMDTGKKVSKKGTTVLLR